MRKRGRVDANHGDIVNALREAGASVTSLASLGKGCPDLLVGFRGRNYLMEVKNGDKSMLTQDEFDWFMHWQGASVVVRSPNDALKVISE